MSTTRTYQTRTYDLEIETKEYLKACKAKSIVNQTNIKTLNDYVINRKTRNLNASFLANSPIVLNGLVLWLDAGVSDSYPAGGTVWKDLASSNNGTLINGPAFNSDNGGSIVFDGVDDYTQQTNDLLLGTNFTISLVFKQTATRSDWVRLFGHGNGGERFWGIWMPDNRGYLLWQSYSNGGQVGSSGYTFNLNTVYNIVLTSEGSTRTFYVNGVLLSTHSTGGTINYGSTTEKIRIGYAGFHTYFVGSIYNASIYNKTLTPTEILQNYNATKGKFGL